MRNINFAVALLVAGITIVTLFSGCIGGNEQKSNQVPTDYPAAAISASAPSMAAGGDEPITFDASNSTGSIVSYSWDFGDGETGSGKVIDHSYANPGYYIVNLTVLTASGLESKDSMQVAAFAPLENAVTEWTDPQTVGITYPDEIKADLLTRPVFIFFWHESCQWCDLQEVEANEFMDAMYMGSISIFKINTHTEIGHIWAGNYFHLMYVPTNIIIRQDGKFVALIGTATFGSDDPSGAVGSGDLKAYFDDALKFKTDNANTLNITEKAEDGIISPASPAPQDQLEVKNGTAVLTAYINWDKAQEYGIAAANSLDIVLTAPNGTKYVASEIQVFDPTEPLIPGNLKPDPYRSISIANPAAGTWKLEVTASGAGGAAPAITDFTLHTLMRGGNLSGCHDGVCPP
ncbi:MAG: PKD domain-containing protein [Candidatus Thermoplasmatota archaeon]|nr:PKD domain-containing protein [Candidatus Thermoplasmatota archaeon]